MSKNNENNVELTAEVANAAMFPPKEISPAEAMAALFPQVDDELRKKLLPTENADVDSQQRAEARARVETRVRELIQRMDPAEQFGFFKKIQIGQAIHPGKLAEAIGAQLPKQWESVILPDESNQTPEERLASIVVRIPRAIVTKTAQELVSERGLTESEQTRAVRKALKNTATAEVGKVLPLKVESADRADREDRIVAMMRFVRQQAQLAK